MSHGNRMKDASKFWMLNRIRHNTTGIGDLKRPRLRVPNQARRKRPLFLETEDGKSSVRWNAGLRRRDDRRRGTRRLPCRFRFRRIRRRHPLRIDRFEG
ncbi:hypothetical protein Bcep18194_C6681 [Burkholderia lata]|uniref:Uncharacterized protein n=1 Tax=Burkholderia lata (strain ATCC 17760 / DSM 23089 / LMG 22485 / NCIMB 9086 / R18194 / 383) TaxID=482957 RepID=Q39P85_BURL3|nr:hypothetical protein Bcep18194_C6681 [Burkholderia lata]